LVITPLELFCNRPLPDSATFSVKPLLGIVIVPEFVNEDVTVKLLWSVRAPKASTTTLAAVMLVADGIVTRTFCRISTSSEELGAPDGPHVALSFQLPVTLAIKRVVKVDRMICELFGSNESTARVVFVVGYIPARVIVPNVDDDAVRSGVFGRLEILLLIVEPSLLYIWRLLSIPGEVSDALYPSFSVA